MAEVETTATETQETVGTTETEVSESAEIAKLRAEMARQKAALDKATKEAGDYKKQLRAKQSEEEISAEEKRIENEARDKELAELRKRFAVSETSKKLMGFIGDESASNSIAEYLYGAEDLEGAISALNKAWATKEKKLKMEYGKIPAPGSGDSNGAGISKEQLDSMTYVQRLDFATKHPDEYNALMGRTQA